MLAEVESEFLGEEKTLRLPVKPEWVGRRLLVAVRYESSSDPSEDSDLRELDVTAPLPTVATIETEVGDGEVALRWEDLRPAAAAAAPLSRPLFEVYRRRGAETRRTALVPTPAWSDGSVVWGAEVCYAVQLVAVGDDEPRLLEDPGPEVDADPGTPAMGVAAAPPGTPGPADAPAGIAEGSPSAPEARLPGRPGAPDEPAPTVAEAAAAETASTETAATARTGEPLSELTTGERPPSGSSGAGPPRADALPAASPPATEESGAAGPPEAAPAAEPLAPGPGETDETAGPGPAGQVLPEPAAEAEPPPEGPEAGSPGAEAQPSGRRPVGTEEPAALGPAGAPPAADESGTPTTDATGATGEMGQTGEAAGESVAREERPAEAGEAGTPGADAPGSGNPGAPEEPAPAGPRAAAAGPGGSGAVADTGETDASAAPGWTPVVVRVPPTGAEAVSAGTRSPEVCLVPEDLYPPPPPTDLRAFWRSEGTDLNWEASAAPDVAGYRVYRSATDDSGYELLAEGPADLLTVTDRDRDPGTAYTYAVTAIDAAGTPNESPRSAPVRVRPREP